MEPVDLVAVYGDGYKGLHYENNNTWKINKKQSSSESVLKFIKIHSFDFGNWYVWKRDFFRT